MYLQEFKSPGGINGGARKRQKEYFKCQIDECDSTFESEKKLKLHYKDQHPYIQEKAKEKFSLSPEASPPRKKVVMIDAFTETVSSEENFECYKRVLQAKIKISKLDEYTESDESKSLETPEYLSEVNEKHIKHLRGFKMLYKAEPNGACLTNCDAMFIYEDENKSVDMKRTINDHIVEHWENFYKYKISLPYIQTVGIGCNAKQIRCETVSDLNTFLKSDDSLTAFSDSQEVFAIANIFNINVHIFKYNFPGQPDKCEWSLISPHPEMIFLSKFPAIWMPDLTLYYQVDCHYDLLVGNKSRLALLRPRMKTKEVRFKPSIKQLEIKKKGNIELPPAPGTTTTIHPNKAFDCIEHAEVAESSK